MEITQAQMQSLLSNIPEGKRRRELADIVTGRITKEVHCMSEDVVREEEDLARDENGKIILDKKGNTKVVKVKRVIRQGCKGRHIANIYKTGKVVMTFSEGKAWLRSSRDRLDGEKGFQCWCGNNSLLAIQERGHITEVPPTKDDLSNVWEKLQASPPKYPTVKKQKLVDGFMIKELT